MSLELLTAWWDQSRRTCYIWWLFSWRGVLRSQDVDAASFLRLGTRNWYSSTSAIFYWSKQSLGLLRFKERVPRPYFSIRGVLKNLQTSFMCHSLFQRAAYNVRGCCIVTLWPTIQRRENFKIEDEVFYLKVLNLLILKYWQLIQVFWKTRVPDMHICKHCPCPPLLQALHQILIEKF